MSFLEDVLPLLAQTVTIAPWTGQDTYGEATYGAAVSYAARVEGKMQMIRDAVGAERVSAVTVYLATTASISPKDKLTLPSGWTPQTPALLAVQRHADESGDHHTVLYA
jgi:hypothetical protein